MKFATAIAATTLGILALQPPGCEDDPTETKPRGVVRERINIEKNVKTPYASLTVYPEGQPSYVAKVNLGTDCTVGDYYPDCEKFGG